ncbi:MAG TPA: diguanylate cyclase [Pusillimonas sp.]|jgi:diguanylate cyclase (GGDEF)-like protein/PAS domain S-box-containing protein|nr:diguanylate cyclase [Pusillimonas sp.]|tara:strand:+ start:66947 stop:68284 length:1338 start_codon:yes stop_codon:yes gene_type:complete
MKLNAETLLPEFLDLMLDTVFMVDAEGCVVFVGAACERMFGYSQQELIGRRMIDFVAPEDRDRTLQEAQQVMSGVARVGFENRYVRKDGRYVRVMWSAYWSDKHQCRIGVARDVTERRRLEECQAATYAVSEAAHRAQDLGTLFKEVQEILARRVPVATFAVADFDHETQVQDWIFRQDNAYPWSVSLSTRLLAICSDSKSRQAPLLMQQDVPDVLRPAEQSGTWLFVPLHAQSGYMGTLVMSCTRGALYGSTDIELLRFVGGQVATAIERQRMHAELLRMAQYDDLTGLLNRRTLHAHLRATLARYERRQASFALLFVDLDDFKSVNDSYGHLVGDQLLMQIAIRLKRSVRQGDTVFRLGGDEFLVLLEDIHTKEDARQVAAKLKANVSEPVVIEGSSLNAYASVGLACYPDDARQIDALLSHADQEMYVMKRRRQGALARRFY